jgi:hypothetical protein
MEVVRPHDGGGSDTSRTAASAAWCEADDIRVLESLAALVAEGPLTDELPARAVDRVVELLGLSGATLSLVRERDGTMELESVASVGAHAAFARDMSARPLETLADVATAVAEGKPVFVVDSHGPASSPGTETGVGRWRSTISAHATGVLPVRAWGETLGVLTVEWPGSRPLEDRERTLLEAVAGILGVMLHGLELDESHAGTDEPEVAEGPAESIAVYGVTTDGVVVPLSGADFGDVSPVMTLSVATRAGVPDETAIANVGSIGDRSVGFTIGTTTVRGEAPGSVAGMAIDLLHTYASQGVDPSQALVYLGHAVRATAHEDARVSALTCSIEVSGSAIVLTFSTAGAVMSALRSSDGRLSLELSDSPALSGASTRASRDRHMLLLAGDVAVFASGQVGPLGTARGTSALRSALGNTPDGGVEAARAILGMFEDRQRAATVLVVEVPRTPREA